MPLHPFTYEWKHPVSEILDSFRILDTGKSPDTQEYQVYENSSLGMTENCLYTVTVPIGNEWFAS
jgi:hypothetical protein